MSDKELQDKVEEILNDPWGEPVADDVVQALVAFIRSREAQVRFEILTVIKGE